MNTISDFTKGDIVRFGRSQGEKTLGEVIKVNRKKLKVRQLEARGRKKSHQIGSIWGVPPSICEKVEDKKAFKLLDDTPPLRRKIRKRVPNSSPSGTLTMANVEVGDIIRFGSPQGERTLAEVTKVNKKRIKVRTLENRGVRKVRPPGAIYSVDPRGCERVEKAHAKEVLPPEVFYTKDLDEKAAQDALEGALFLSENCDLSNPPTYIKSSRRYLDGHSLSEFGCEQDSRKQKLYDSERGVSKGKQFKNLRQATKFLNKVLESSWFQRRFGKIEVKMEMTQGWKKSYCRRTEGLLRMLPQHLNERVILHELVHALTPKPHAGHGRLFCAIYLDFVRHYIGESTYDQLLKGYRREGVQYTPNRSEKR